MAKRVLVVDDHLVVLYGVRALIEADPDLMVVGEAQDRDSAIRLTAELRPDAVVLDLRLDGSYAADTAGRLKSACPTTRVLLHTATEEPEPVRAALRAGADAVVFKDGRDLLPTLHQLLAGDIVPVEPERPRRPSLRRADRSAQFVEELSPREYEVLCAFAIGQSTRDIAANLFLAESTVRSYTKSLLTKLGAHSRVEALAAARRVSLI